MVMRRDKALPFRLLGPDGELVVSKIKALERFANKRATEMQNPKDTRIVPMTDSEAREWAVKFLEEGLEIIAAGAYADSTENG